MRIVIPSTQVPFIAGGGELMTSGLMKALRNAGHEVEIVTLPFKFFPEAYISDLIDFWVKQDFNNFSGYEVDKVVALQFPAYYVKHKDKTVWLIHQHRTVYDLYDDSKASDQLKNLRRKIVEQDKRELSQVKRICTISQNVSNRLARYNSLESTPLYPPPYGEEDFYCEEPYNYIFCPSRLEALKRQDLLIQAMKYSRTPVRAILAGDGGQRERYGKLIEELGLTDRVKLLGRITEEEKHALYARALAIFFGPFDEDYGYITLEAMLSSKPVITCTDSGGALEFVVHEETGFVLDPQPEAIAEKIDWFYHHFRRARQMGENGLEAYKTKNISWENVTSKLLED